MGQNVVIITGLRLKLLEIKYSEFKAIIGIKVHFLNGNNMKFFITLALIFFFTTPSHSFDGNLRDETIEAMIGNDFVANDISCIEMIKVEKCKYERVYLSWGVTCKGIVKVQTKSASVESFQIGGRIWTMVPPIAKKKLRTNMTIIKKDLLENFNKCSGYIDTEY